MKHVTAGVAEPLPAMDLDFVIEPVLAALEEAVGLGAVLEGAAIRPQVSEYVFAEDAILAQVTPMEGGNLHPRS